MFRCQQCGYQAKPGEDAHKKVVETREVVYPKREKAGDPGGKGVETVRELTVCKTCS